MSVLVLKTAEPDAEIIAVYATVDDLMNDWPGKSWTPLGEDGWHDGHDLYAQPAPWYEHVVPVHLRGASLKDRVNAAHASIQTVPGRMSFTVLEKG